MEEYKRNLAVGVTTLAGLAGLLTLMMMFGRLPLPGTASSGYRIKVAMPEAGGLHVESRVKLSGIGVGEVESVSFRKPPKRGVIVVARIQQDVDIPKAVTATATRTPLGGSPTLDLNVSEHASVTQHLSKTNVPTIQGRPSSMADRLGEAVKSALGGPMDKVDRVAASIEKLSNEWTRVGKNVNRLVQPRDPATVDAGEGEANLATVIERTDKRMRQMGRTLEGVEKIVNDEGTIRDLRQTLANAREASAKLSNEVDNISDKLTGDVDALKKRYIALADDLTGAVKAIEKLVNKTNQGEGTIGKLINDPELYENLNDAAQRINKAVDEMKLLFQKWKAEGVPVQF